MKESERNLEPDGEGGKRGGERKRSSKLESEGVE